MGACPDLVIVAVEASPWIGAAPSTRACHRQMMTSTLNSKRSARTQHAAQCKVENQQRKMENQECQEDIFKINIATEVNGNI
jgi:hypothetical protein